MTTILQYQKYCDLGTGRTDMEYLSEVSKIIGIDVSKLNNDQVIEKITEWINTIIAIKKEIKYLKIQKKWYKVDKDLYNLKFSQWINFDSIVNGMTNEKAYNEIHYVVATFIRPCRLWKLFPRKFNMNDFIKTSKIVQEHMDIKEALNLYNFFLSYTINSMNNSNISYLEKLEAMTWVETKEQQK